jgi:WD40 repeat protein
MAWSAAHDARHVFWLNGLAGTGKSTIARTVARRCADAGRLGASFFFMRGGGELASARKFATTVAVQLAAALPALKPHICAAAGALRDVRAAAPYEQWERLVLQPLAKVSRSGKGDGGRQALPLREQIVIVIDVLDECDNDVDVSAILGLMALGATASGSSCLRVLLTSRPETPVRFGILAIPSASRDCLVLHDLNPRDVDRDISVYLADSLRRVGTVFLYDADWPGVETIDRLVSQACGLFILAATAYRFIARGGSRAQGCLQDILSGVSNESTPAKSHDAIYLTILSKAIGNDLPVQEQVNLGDALFAVLGTVAALATPVNRNTLSTFAEVSPDLVNQALHGLHSIFAIPDDVLQPIRLLHASFREFVMDPDRCSDVRFLIDGKQHHKILAKRCLSLMAEHHRKDICDYRDPGVRLPVVDRPEVQRRLPPFLQDACCYWSYRIEFADYEFELMSAISSFLHVHLLHWLEALCLLRRLPQAVGVLGKIEQLTVCPLSPPLYTDLLKCNQGGVANADLRSFAYDAKRFVLSYVSMMAEYPLQIYSSALVFAPSRSLVRQRFLLDVPPWISSIPVARENWRGKMLTIETTPPVITPPPPVVPETEPCPRSERLVFSPDGQTLALASQQRGISFWDPTTGASRGTIAPPKNAVSVTIAFSPDGRFFAYMFQSIKAALIGLRDVELQAVRNVIEGKSDSAYAILRFSPTSELFAACITRDQLMLLDARSMAVRKMTIACYPLTASFSPTGRFLALASLEDGISVADIGVGKSVKSSTHDSRSSGLFSPRDELLAYSWGSTVKFWRRDDVEVPPDLDGHTEDIRDLVLSPDGKLLAFLCSRKCSVWEVTVGSRLYCVENTDNTPWAPPMLLDCRLLAWRRNYHAASFWSANRGNPYGSLRTSSKGIFMAFAPNSQLFACASAYGNVDIWDINNIPSQSTGCDGVEQLVAVTPLLNGRYLASISRVGLLRVWDMMRGDFCCVLNIHFYLTESLDISDNGLRLALTFESGTIKVLDIRDGKLTLTLRGQGHRFLAFAPNSQVVAIGKAQRAIVVHEFGSESRTTLAIGPHGWRAAAFSPSGNVLAVASGEHVTIYSGRSWKKRHSIRSGWLQALVAAPDNERIACAAKNSIKLLDLSKGGGGVAALNLEFEAERLSFSSDGRQLVTLLGALPVPAKGPAMPLSMDCVRRS